MFFIRKHPNDRHWEGAHQHPPQYYQYSHKLFQAQHSICCESPASEKNIQVPFKTPLTALEILFAKHEGQNHSKQANLKQMYVSRQDRPVCLSQKCRVHLPNQYHPRWTPKAAQSTGSRESDSNLRSCQQKLALGIHPSTGSEDFGAYEHSLCTPWWVFWLRGWDLCLRNWLVVSTFSRTKVVNSL